MPHDRAPQVSGLKKNYASQQSVDTTLTRVEREAHLCGASGARSAPAPGHDIGPFELAAPDPEPLPAVTREAVLVDETGARHIVGHFVHEGGRRRFVPGEVRL